MSVVGNATRGRILAVARRMLVDRGYHNFAMQEIAKSVGIPRTAIYRHFENKECVLDAIARESIVTFISRARRLSARIAADSSPLDMILERLAEGLAALYAADYDLNRAVFEECQIPVALARLIANDQRSMIRSLEEKLRDHPQLQNDQRDRQAHIVVHAIHAVVHNDSYLALNANNIKQRYSDLVRLLLDGIRRRPTAANP